MFAHFGVSEPAFCCNVSYDFNIMQCDSVSLHDIEHVYA